MNANMQKMFDSLRDGIMIVGEDGMVRYANSVAVKTFAVLPGRPLPAESIRLQVKAAAEGYLKPPITLEVSAPEHSEHADNVRATLLESPVGKDYVLVFHNLTESQFFENTAHNLAELLHQEFMSPLAELAQGLEHLLDRLATDEANASDSQPTLRKQGEIEKASRGVIEAGMKLGHHIEQLKSYAETFGHAPMLANERIVIQDLVSKTLLRLRPALAEKQLRVSLAGVSDDLPVIYGSAHWLSQALAEYIRNLAKRAKEGSEFLLAIKSNSNFIMIQIEDRGCGIPSHLRERAFLPFHRVMEGDTGLGLGLALCKRIIELHGGHVRLSQDAEDEDRFTIELPVGAASMRDADADLKQAQRYAQDIARLMQRRAHVAV